ncbi:TetR/AcrR family transcriptional regulator [Streptomyces sp. NBC_00525]|uniref:TetR/AcrR family transcriptional regulator n=1 Tax=Streptomyces sp. NBC_00525 TaxID=2903660 RepID=UPI002E815BC6|nr:TetR/AcrR family transcriptional regulator [Streptomyces sp. NBC_00525]WUC96869.1 TetR/AcrR family transcriptional regulator [Streptomyces sp. NBC_00525]
MRLVSISSTGSGTDAATRRGGHAIDAQHVQDRAGGGHAGRTRNGPRRSEAARLAVLRAADDLLVDVGFHAMTVGAIAERAGVAKQTIYRWWRSKVDILLDVLDEDLRDLAFWPELPQDPQATLEQYATHVGAVFTEPATGRVLFVLIGHAQHDTATAAALRDEVLRPQRQYDRRRVQAALASSLHSTVTRQEADQLLDLVVGPAFHRAFMTGRPLDPQFARQLTTAVLALRDGVTPPGTPSPDSSA